MTRRYAFLVFLVVGVACGVAPTVAQDRLPSHSVGIVPTEGLSADVRAAARAAVRGEGPAKSGGRMDKIGMELALLHFQYQQNGAAGIRALRTAATREPSPKSREDRRPTPRVRFPVSSNGRLVTVEAVAAEAPSELLGALRGLGLEGGAVAGNLVSGRLPIKALDQAARLPALRGMVPSLMRTHVGRVGSEADTSHNVIQVRENQGLDGTGQKVCALSDSYNNNASALTTASEDVESGDLPGAGNPEGNTTPVDVLDDGVATGSDEGRAMLQLIHDIAPGAELGFHTAFKGVGNFAQGVRELADAGCTIIVDDVGSSIEPFYQDGPVSNAVDDVVQNDGAAYFSSAGNDGQNSYEAPFRNSGMPGVVSGSSVRHDFDPGATTVDTEQSITIQAGGEFTIFSFQWTDPSAIVAGSEGADTDLDIALVNAADSIVAQSSRDNIGTGVPVESIEYTNDSGASQTLDLVVEKAAGPDPDEIKYVYSGRNVQINEYDTLGPTIYGHPMAEGAMAVAAAPFFNTATYNSDADPATLESFSSKGGIPILFDQSGTRLSTPVQRQKPDVTGTDGIDNTFLGFDLPDDFFGGVDADPYPNFFGTSAAAPNVAAIAALVRQARPGMPPTEVYNRLESTAADVTDRANRSGDFVSVAAGVDPWSGHGFVQASQAVPRRDIFDVQLAETADPQTGTFELTWRQRSNITVESYKIEKRYFDESFEPVSATVTKSGDQRTADVGALGLGVFTFRIQWTRSDGTTRQRTTRPDTLGFRGITSELRLPGDIPNPRGRRTAALSWMVPAGTNGFSYEVERRRGEDGTFEVIGTTQDPGFNARLQAPGRYSYRITARDGRGHSLTSPAKPVEIEFDGAAVAIGPYPNPVRESATLDLTVADGQTVTVEVYNTIGEQVFRDRRRLAARTATSLRVDAGRWSSGVYFLRVRGEGFTKTRKLVVVK
ncbi:MAG: T9SS type A sorting domain-containing protein [Salinibacter sp.]